MSFVDDQIVFVRFFIRIQENLTGFQSEIREDQIQHLVDHVVNVAVIIGKHPPQLIQQRQIIIGFCQFLFPDRGLGIEPGIVDRDP